jgi:hypothetical protein
VDVVRVVHTKLHSFTAKDWESDNIRNRKSREMTITNRLIKHKLYLSKGIYKKKTYIYIIN